MDPEARFSQAAELGFALGLLWEAAGQINY